MALKDFEAYINEGTLAKPPVFANYYFQEEVMGYSRYRLTPGHFYTFTMVNRVPNDFVPNVSEMFNKDQMEKYSVKRPYFDNRPVFLSLGNDGQGGEIILNLKMIPQNRRAQIIRKYLKTVQNQVTKFYRGEKLMPFNERLVPELIGPFLSVNTAFMSRLTGINLSFALNKYQREQMANIGLIDWEDVSKIEQIDYRNDPSIAVKTPVSILINEFGK